MFINREDQKQSQQEAESNPFTPFYHQGPGTETTVEFFIASAVVNKSKRKCLREEPVERFPRLYEGWRARR